MAEPPDSSVLRLYGIIRGGLVTTPEMAVKFAEVVIESMYGADEVEQQRPFIPTDQSDRWMIEGSYNRDKTIEGKGSAKVIINKSDARVIDAGVPSVMVLSDDAKKYLSKFLD